MLIQLTQRATRSLRETHKKQFYGSAFILFLLQLLASIFVQKEDINSSGHTSYKKCYIFFEQRKAPTGAKFIQLIQMYSRRYNGLYRSEKEEKSTARVRELKMKDRLSKETT